MILPFSTQLNGKPTRFVEKIVFGLYKNGLISVGKASELLETPMSIIEVFENQKIHTIREDKNNRWKVGTMIDFFINVRQKNMYKFAPVLPVVSTQPIDIKNTTYTNGSFFRKVSVEGFMLYHEYDKRIIDNGLLEFAQNDGFDTIEDFFEYFNKDFTGKIIHWTDKRY